MYVNDLKCVLLNKYHKLACSTGHHAPSLRSHSHLPMITGSDQISSHSLPINKRMEVPVVDELKKKWVGWLNTVHMQLTLLKLNRGSV